jgi:hypothetical protein
MNLLNVACGVKVNKLKTQVLVIISMPGKHRCLDSRRRLSLASVLNFRRKHFSFSLGKWDKDLTAIIKDFTHPPCYIKTSCKVIRSGLSFTPPNTFEQMTKLPKETQVDLSSYPTSSLDTLLYVWNFSDRHTANEVRGDGIAKNETCNCGSK